MKIFDAENTNGAQWIRFPKKMGIIRARRTWKQTSKQKIKFCILLCTCINGWLGINVRFNSSSLNRGYGKHGEHELCAVERLGILDAQADLSLRWAHSHVVGFVMRRLTFCFFLSAYSWPVFRLLTRKNPFFSVKGIKRSEKYKSNTVCSP